MLGKEEIAIFCATMLSNVLLSPTSSILHISSRRVNTYDIPPLSIENLKSLGMGWHGLIWNSLVLIVLWDFWLYNWLVSNSNHTSLLQTQQLTITIDLWWKRTWLMHHLHSHLSLESTFFVLPILQYIFYPFENYQRWIRSVYKG